jgi:dihydroorotase
MSKFLYLGMPLEKVIQASTATPATAMRLQDRLGSLKPGMQADVLLMRQETGQFPLEDVESQLRVSPHRVVPVQVCKRGVWSNCSGAR